MTNGTWSPLVIDRIGGRFPSSDCLFSLRAAAGWSALASDTRTLKHSYSHIGEEEERTRVPLYVYQLFPRLPEKGGDSQAWRPNSHRPERRLLDILVAVNDLSD